MDDQKNEDRRRNDEAFKMRIVESQAEIKTLIATTNQHLNDLNTEIANHARALLEIQHCLWGGPRESDIGLLEKHRRLNRNWTIAMGVVAFLWASLGKAVSPILQKWAEDYYANSPAHKWMVEQSRPKVKVIRVYPRKGEPE